MAQRVGHFDNLKEEDYTEGPFVVASVNGPGDCRVEVFLRGHKCPVLPDQSVYDYFKKHSAPLRGDPETIGVIVDALNQLVGEGVIVEEDRWFVMREL